MLQPHHNGVQHLYTRQSLKTSVIKVTLQANKGDRTQMPQQNGKTTFYREARKQGNSIIVTLPADLVKENDIQPGDKIGFQQEHSQEIAERKDREHGHYWSNWNETTQNGERKP